MKYCGDNCSSIFAYANFQGHDARDKIAKMIGNRALGGSASLVSMKGYDTRFANFSLAKYDEDYVKSQMGGLGGASIMGAIHDPGMDGSGGSAKILHRKGVAVAYSGGCDNLVKSLFYDPKDRDVMGAESVVGYFQREMHKIEDDFSMIYMRPDGMIAARRGDGFLRVLYNNDAENKRTEYFVSSDTDMLTGQFMDTIHNLSNPVEMAVITENGMRMLAGDPVVQKAA